MPNAKPIHLNNVESTVQAGSSAIGSASATGVNVATGDGAKFGTVGTDEFIPAAIADASGNVTEYVWITAISADALTVTRQAESSSQYPASATTIQSGYTIFATTTKFSLDLRNNLATRYQKLDTAVVETISRDIPQNWVSVLASGRLTLIAITLPAGLTISKIGFGSGNTAAGTPTHWWFGLYDSSRVQLAVTADQTTTAWTANTIQSLAVATTATGSASSYTTTYTGLHYIGIMVAATTVPTLNGNGLNSALTGSPVWGFVGNTGQTTPPAFPFTVSNGGTVTSSVYGFVA